MFKRKLLKQSKLKRLLLKLLNIYAYDKETLNIVNPNYKNNQKNIAKFNEKTFNFSRGYLNLTRKINKLDIYFRYAPNNHLWNASKGTQRIIKNISKEKLIAISLLSLKGSILNFLENNKLDISINLIGDSSNSNFDNHLFEILKSEKFEVFFHKTKVDGNRGSYLECCDQAVNAEDLIFFIEDDYLFELNCIEEMLLTFSRVSSLLNEDIVLCPSDYAFYYDSLYSTSLHIGKDYKWRNVGETLLTFLMSKKIFNKFNKLIRLVGTDKNDPFEKPLHDLYNQINCLAPVGSLSHHISRHVPIAHNEDWMKLWVTTSEIYDDLNLTSNYS